MKTAFIFSGQGAQYPGMGKEFYDTFPECREVFEQAEAVLDFPLTDICFNENEKERLDKTEFCQAAIFTVCAAIIKRLEKLGITADFGAGLSLGEYTALWYSGVFGFSDTVGLLRKRGIFMAEASADVDGVMSAVLGLSSELVEKACAEAMEYCGEYCAVSNYNAPGQAVISGACEAVGRAEEICLSNGAKRVVRLAVSGPYHTPFMKSAAEKLGEYLQKVPVGSPRIPIVTNVDAGVYKSGGVVAETLLAQITGAVRFEDCVRTLRDMGADTFVEIGPGRTLSAFVKKILPDAGIYNIENITSCEKTAKGLLG